MLKIAGEMKLEDGTSIPFSYEIGKLYSLKDCLVMDVYRSRLLLGETSSIAAMNTAILCGYEAPSAIMRIVKEQTLG